MSGFKDEQIHTLFYGGGADMTCTLNNAAATFSWTRDALDKPVHMATIAATAHGFSAGSRIFIEGTTAYNGLWQINTLPDANSFTLLHQVGGASTFAAETFAGTETGKVVLAPGVPFKLLEMGIHLSSASATAENLTVTLDANKGAAWDEVILSQGMNTVADYAYIFDTPRVFEAGDKLRWAWTNTNARTWAMTIKYVLGSH